MRLASALLAVALAALAPPAFAQADMAGDAPEAAPPASAATNAAVVWAPVPGVVVAAPDSAALVAVVAAAPVETPVESAERGVLIATGRASYYGERFRGRRTASGERFNPDALTAAHRTLRFGTRLRVTNVSNGRSVVVRVTDRGPFHGNRILDLSKEAARRIGMIRSGTARVRIERL